ncbi:MAG: nuclear transport factor 2 family protein [Alphaproteobacteria bacterium]
MTRRGWRPTGSVAKALLAMAVMLSGMAASLTATPARAEPYDNVTYKGELLARDTPRGAMQWAMLDMAKAWADCDPVLMDSLIADDIDFSFPTSHLKGRAEVLHDLDIYCGTNAKRPPEEVSFHLPPDAFYIDLDANRVAVEIQFRELRSGRQQVTNDVWIATIEGGRFTVMKEYLDGRVRDLQALGVLTYDWDGDFLTPWPPRTEEWKDCFPIVRAAPTNSCPPQ